jgi:hypothetical protein
VDKDVANQDTLRSLINNGTAAVACMLLNRNCTSVENEQIQFSLLPSRVNVAYNHCRTHLDIKTGRSPIHKKGVDALNTEIDVEI